MDQVFNWCNAHKWTTFSEQVNYFKAQYLVALSHLMWKEKMFVLYA